jgi:hypothetical protein
MMEAGLLLYVVLVVACALVLICRAGLMTPDTDPAVRWQHLSMLAGQLFGLALALNGFAGLAGACHAGGVLAWLLLSASRWRNGPPAGTMKPVESKL